MLKKLLMAAAATVAMSGAASAATLTITSATADCAAGNTPDGIDCGSSDRRNLDAVELGESVGGDFFSLGLGGQATFYINPNFTSPGTALEVTNGRERYYDETADVYGRNILSEQFEFLGTVSNADAVSTFEFAGTFDAIRFLDTTIVPDNWTGGGNDGYDLAAFTVAPVPLPAGGLLLLGGLGALGVASRRRRKSA